MEETHAQDQEAAANKMQDEGSDQQAQQGEPSSKRRKGQTGYIPVSWGGRQQLGEACSGRATAEKLLFLWGAVCIAKTLDVALFLPQMADAVSIRLRCALRCTDSELMYPERCTLKDARKRVLCLVSMPPRWIWHLPGRPVLHIPASSVVVKMLMCFIRRPLAGHGSFQADGQAR